MWIKGYKNLYQINNKGEVISFKKSKEGRLMKPRQIKSGYYTVDLIDKKGILLTCYIHRLVAESFIPNPENKKLVIHRNGDVADNRISNLIWSNNSDKLNRQWKNKISKLSNEKMVNSKLSKTDLISIAALLNNKKTTTEVAKFFNISRMTLLKVRKSKQFLNALKSLQQTQF